MGKKGSSGKSRSASKQKIKIHEHGLKLIRLMRSIGYGEINSVQIKDGLPIAYKTAWKKEKLS